MLRKHRNIPVTAPLQLLVRNGTIIRAPLVNPTPGCIRNGSSLPQHSSLLEYGIQMSKEAFKLYHRSLKSISIQLKAPTLNLKRMHSLNP